MVTFHCQLSGGRKFVLIAEKLVPGTYAGDSILQSGLIVSRAATGRTISQSSTAALPTRIHDGRPRRIDSHL